MKIQMETTQNHYPISSINTYPISENSRRIINFMGLVKLPRLECYGNKRKIIPGQRYWSYHKQESFPNLVQKFCHFNGNEMEEEPLTNIFFKKFQELYTVKQ